MSTDARPWHAADDVVARYADGSLPEPDAWSLEKHLERCGGCADRVSAAVRATSAGAVLTDVRRAVLAAAPATAAAPSPAPVAAGAAPAPAPLPRTPAAGDHTYRRPAASRTPARLARLLWAAGPAVRGAWAAAVVVVAAAAPVLAHAGGMPGTRALLLAVAPALPVAGVGLSYGPHADPLHEITASTPSGGLRLLLTRTAAVLAVSLPLLTLAGLLLPASGAPAAAAWLLPGLALVLGSLALTPWLGCRTAAAVTGGGWLAAVLAPTVTATGDGFTGRLAGQLARCLDGAAAQGGWAAAAAAFALLLAARRTSYDHLDRR